MKMNDALCLLKTIGNKDIKSNIRKKLLLNLSKSGCEWLRSLLYNLTQNSLKYKPAVLKEKFAPYRSLIHRFIDIKRKIKNRQSLVKIFLTPKGWDFISQHLANIIDRFAQLFEATDEKPVGVLKINQDLNTTEKQDEQVQESNDN